MTVSNAPDVISAENIELIGYHDLEKRPAFKIAMQEVNERFYLYLSTFWQSGWTVLDVTDPASPEHCDWLPGPDNCWTLQVQVADGLMITSMEKIPEGWGPRPNDPPEAEGVYIWDVATDPAHPKRIAHWETGADGTHRNFYNGGRYAHLSAGAEGYRSRIYRVLDLEDPANPKEAGRWWLPEQELDENGKPRSPINAFQHGPAHAENGRVYLPYAGGGIIILDIEDISAPKMISRLNVHPPLGSNLAVHTVYPYLDRNIAIANSEALRENCDEPLNYTAVIDIKDETNPRVMSIFPVPDPPKGYSHKNFCERGGRFGPHNQHHSQGL
ncbi:MAG: hypothetical protein HOL05_15485, partial [Nitrospinaceae bacterium]|nr:hypothetical protein [Nitrospinaceae bacterium]